MPDTLQVPVQAGTGSTLRVFLRRYVIALSFVNLCYAAVWKRLLDIRKPAEFTIKTLPASGEYLGAICGVLICALIVVAFDALLRRGPRMMRAGVLVAGFAFLILRGQALLPEQVIPTSAFLLARAPSFALFGIVGVVLAGAVFRYQEAVTRAVTLLLLICAPFCVFTFAYSLYAAASPATLHDRPLAARLPRKPGPRVLWIVFDEWDQRLSFDARSPNLAMPHVDALRKESFFAENALPPAGMTILSMPALIAGHRVRSEKALGPDTLLVTYDNGTTLPFGARPNIFSEVRDAGMNAAVAGWFLPYCRTLNSYVTDCWWQEADFRWNSYGTTFHDAFLNQPRSLLETARFSPFGQSLPTLKHLRTFDENFEQSKRIASDNDVQFALFHYDIPHPPFFYDPKTGRMNGDSWSNYTDGLALLDKAVGDLRADMERSGVWNNTSIVLTTDHFYRGSRLVNGKRDQRIPFIVHFPGESAGLSYSRSFNTIVTHDLILALLRSEVTDAAGLQHWLDRH
jgi:hypothetical protein